MITAAHFKDVVNGYEKRTDGLWVHTGKVKVNGPFEVVGGPVSMPDGTGQVLRGTYANIVTYAIPSGGVWYETPIQANLATTGRRLRIDWTVPVMGANAGQTYWIGLGINGTHIWTVGFWHTPAGGYATTLSGVLYDIRPPTASERWGVFLYSSAAGGGINANAYALLNVTEQML